MRSLWSLLSHRTWQRWIAVHVETLLLCPHSAALRLHLLLHLILASPSLIHSSLCSLSPNPPEQDSTEGSVTHVFYWFKTRRCKQEHWHRDLLNSSPKQQDRGSNVIFPCVETYLNSLHLKWLWRWKAEATPSITFSKQNYFISDPMFRRHNKTSCVIFEKINEERRKAAAGWDCLQTRWWADFVFWSSPLRRSATEGIGGSGSSWWGSKTHIRVSSSPFRANHKHVTKYVSLQPACVCPLHTSTNCEFGLNTHLHKHASTDLYSLYKNLPKIEMTGITPKLPHCRHVAAALSSWSGLFPPSLSLYHTRTHAHTHMIHPFQPRATSVSPARASPGANANAAGVI